MWGERGGGWWGGPASEDVGGGGGEADGLESCFVRKIVEEDL